MINYHKINYSLTLKVFMRNSTYKNLFNNRLMFRMKSDSKNNFLHIHPISCLQDEPIKIKMKNLPPKSNVTLVSSIKDFRDQAFFTYTHYCADSSGTIDLEIDASLSGTYTGVFPMGPIAHLEAGPNELKYLRLSKRNVITPLQVNFKLLNGHLNPIKSFAAEGDVVLDRVTHERIYMTPRTERIPIKNGRVRGTLFLPEGNGPFPGVIDLYGSSGGLVEYRAAQFAARGIASLALAYFGYEDLPTKVEYLDINYFEEAVKLMLNNEKVKKDGVGAVGLSKGGDLACSMGTFIPEVKAVVCINGIPANVSWPLKVNKKVIPALLLDFDKAKMLNPDLMCTYDMLPDSEDFPETHIPLHEADAQFLFIFGTQDKNSKTELETMRGVERMRAKGLSNYEVLRYEGAGHLIEPPYAPFVYASYNRLISCSILWGGFAQNHSAAQVDSWHKMISFLKRVLN